MTAIASAEMPAANARSASEHEGPGLVTAVAGATSSVFVQLVGLPILKDVRDAVTPTAPNLRMIFGQTPDGEKKFFSVPSLLARV